jgi:regulator of sigma E protease
MANFLYAILLFGLVIFVHELGHFLVARYFKVKIFTFSLGFGSALLSWRRGETEYRISMVPLGGYVKMLGENTPEEEIPPEDLPRSFSFKPWWQKCLIVLAGPAMNIVFAFLIYIGISFFNYTSDATIIEFISAVGPARNSALHEGDRIVAINGQRTAVW